VLRGTLKEIGLGKKGKGTKIRFSTKDGKRLNEREGRRYAKRGEVKM